MICPQCGNEYWDTEHHYACPEAKWRRRVKADYDILILTKDDKQFLRDCGIKVPE